MSHPGHDPARWSDDHFLDRLQASTDDLANGCFARLHADAESLAEVNRLFATTLRSGSAPLPPDAPPALCGFVEAFDRTVVDIDHDPAPLARGAQVFRHKALPACLAMLAASLPSGYAAPELSRILTISDDLGTHPYHRLMGVVQLLIDVGGHDDPCNDVVRWSAIKLRLLHAGVRALVPRTRPDFVARFGPPVNHEGMLATIMGFSLVVIDGMERAGLGLEADDAEAYYQLWRHFARLMGIAPADEPASSLFVPKNLDEARAFYASYQRRHFCSDPAENPDGVMLSRRNLEMMRAMIPRWLRWLGLGAAPRMAMTEMLGDEGMRRVGIEPLPATGVRGWIYHFLLRLALLGEDVGEHLFDHLSVLILGGMVRVDMGKIIFVVPDSIADLRKLVEPQKGRSAAAPSSSDPQEALR
ncbi:MAG: oxygenase MpaB family protein [Acidobacteriota bacterium]